jgi:hypothetical protein
VDLDGVSAVYIAGANACNLVELVQVAGRCSRDGKGGKCTLFWNRNQLNNPNTESDVVEFIQTSMCRQRYLSKQMDGIERINCENCDNCSTYSSFSSHSSSSSSFDSSSFHSAFHSPSYSSSHSFSHSSSHSLSSGSIISFTLGDKSENDFRCAVKIVKEAKEKIKQVWKMLEEDDCFICKVIEGRRAKHGLSSCPCWKSRCFGCGIRGANHKSAECPVRPMIQREAIKSGLCFRCLLPPTMYETDCGTMGPACCRPDTLLPVALIRLIEKGTIFTSNFPSILCKFEKGLPNILNLV